MNGASCLAEPAANHFGALGASLLLVQYQRTFANGTSGLDVP